MKKILFLIVLVGLLTIGVFAQKVTNFSGDWTLDVKKSELPEMMKNIESQTMKVTQNDNALTTSTETKGGMMFGGMGRGGGMRPPAGDGQPPPPQGDKSGMPPMMPKPDGKDGEMPKRPAQVATYNLDGSETTAEVEGRMGKQMVTSKAKVGKDGKLELSSSRKFNTPNGEMTFKTTETWELVDSGNSLKISRKQDGRDGEVSSTLYYKKGVAEMKAENSNSIPKTINGGVVNGKATSLVKPAYPAEAKEKGIGGMVKVEILIDENGNIAEAKMVEGNELLRDSSETAARNSKFAPTFLSGVPVKVRGIIIYNFNAGI